MAITLSLDGGMCELRMKCRRHAQLSSGTPLACFEADLTGVRMHKAPYATVSGRLALALHEPQSVLQRWQKQIA
jgi:hypothetical protein